MQRKNSNYLVTAGSLTRVLCARQYIHAILPPVTNHQIADHSFRGLSSITIAYSERRLSTGLANAAFIVCKTISTAVTAVSKTTDPIKGDIVIFIL